jgi:hypothetical protein
MTSSCCYLSAPGCQRYVFSSSCALNVKVWCVSNSYKYVSVGVMLRLGYFLCWGSLFICCWFKLPCSFQRALLIQAFIDDLLKNRLLGDFFRSISRLVGLPLLGHYHYVPSVDAVWPYSMPVNCLVIQKRTCCWGLRSAQITFLLQDYLTLGWL